MDITLKNGNSQPLGEEEIIHDDQLERTVIATMITSPISLQEVHDILTTDCFYDLHNQEIFVTVMEIFHRGEIPDLMMVSNELAKKKSLVSRVELTELCVNTQVLVNIRNHALLLREYSVRRKLWEIGYKLMTKSGQLAESIEFVQNEAKKAIDSVFEESTTELLTMKETYKDLQEKLLIRMSMPDGYMEGTPTGFAPIDENGGLYGTDLTIVGAETSQGKTSFATALALNAIKKGEKVAFYSMEMTNEQLTIRIASMLSGINSRHIKNEKITMEELLRIDKAMEGIDTSLLHFDDKSYSTLDHILMSIRNKYMKYGIKGAVVDYLQLVTLTEKSMTREQGVAKIARDLKNLAKELDIWIIAISQLKRNENNPVPSMSRLRDSGQIEEAADNIFLIYRPRDNGRYPEPYQDIPTQGTAMVKIAKGRNAEVSEFICGFKPENTLFFPIDDNYLDSLKNRLIIKTGETYTYKTIDDEEPF